VWVRWGYVEKTVPRRIEHYERSESRAIQASEPWCAGQIRVWPTRSRTVVHSHAVELKIPPTVLYQRVGVLRICRKTVPRRIEHYERAGSRAMQASEPWCAGQVRVWPTRSRTVTHSAAQYPFKRLE
jgi:hypothetical protein